MCLNQIDYDLIIGIIILQLIHIMDNSINNTEINKYYRIRYLAIINKVIISTYYILTLLYLILHTIFPLNSA